MNFSPKTIVSKKPTGEDKDGWPRLPAKKGYVYAVIKKGENPPGLVKLEVTNGVPNGFFDKDSEVSIVADDPPTGKHFLRWTGDTDNVTDISSSRTDVTINEDTQLEATYEDTIYVLTVNKGTGDGNYLYQEDVHIVADPPPVNTQEFKEWAGDVETIPDITQSDTHMPMPAKDAEITATYGDLRYDLIVNNGEGDGNYLIYTKVNIIADIPPVGKRFVRWDGDTATIEVLHYASTWLEMLDNYEITAVYEDIIPIDPDSDDLFWDIGRMPRYGIFNDERLTNTNPDPAVDRFWDIPFNRNATKLWPEPPYKPIATAAAPGGGSGADLNITIVVDPFEMPITLTQGTVPTLQTTPATPGGGLDTDIGATFGKEQYSFYEPTLPGGLTPPVTYHSEPYNEGCIDEADTLVDYNFTGGTVTLEAIRDESTANTGIYTSDDTDAYLGVTFPAARTFTYLSWYSLWRGDRVNNFVIERYDGGNWTKVPITGVGDQVTIINTDEGQASNKDGWKAVSFSPVSDTGIRIRIKSGYESGDANCGIPEIKVYKEVT